MQKTGVLRAVLVIVALLIGLFLTVLLLKSLNIKFPFISGETFVLLTDEGFRPTLIKINRGETVTFASENGEMFWPASNQHPSHKDWSDFDPKRPLAPHESWSFTFDRVGNWNYHDHLNPKHRGTIEVLGSDGGSTIECLERGENERQSVQAKCWEGEFVEAANTGGLKAAFALQEKYLQDPLFATNCHDVMHVVGEIAYREYKETGETIREENTTVCGFGFYHGFVEEMMRLEGRYDNAKLYCDSISLDPNSSTKVMVENARYACRHGIGHAVFDSLPSGEFWGDGYKMANAGREQCESLFEIQKSRVSCFSGVANALAIAYNHNYYGLNFDQNEHFKVCNSLPDIYVSSCFVEIGIHFANSRVLSFDEAMVLFKKEVPLSSMPYMVEALSLHVTQRKDNNASTISESASFCKNLQNKDWLAWCFTGTAGGFVRTATDDNFVVLSLNLCEEFDTSESLLCLSKTVAALRPYLSDLKMSGLCQQIEERFRASCDILNEQNSVL